MCISLVGDGAFLVALAWQVYVLSGGPAHVARRHRDDGADDPVPARSAAWRATGWSGAGSWSAPIWVRASRSALMAGLALGGQLELWHLVALAALYGTGSAFHAPAFDALVPELLRRRAARAGQRAGPARAPAGAAAGRPGARRRGRRRGRARARCSCSTRASFLIAARRRAADAPARAAAPGRRRGSVIADLRDGWRFVRGHAWLWATFVERGDRVPAVHGPGRGPAAVDGQGRLHG